MKKLHLKTLTAIFILSFLYTAVSCQNEKKQETISIGFYNLENLFDTINNVELSNSEEFTPEGKNQWTSKRYHEKLNHMAFVISHIATDITPEGLAICGVCEVENRGVVEDLVKETSIKDRNYLFVHFESPDERGIDVALLYQPKFFKVTNSAKYRLTIDGDTSFRSRDQLVVTGLLNGDEITVIVNHWPSRYGGEEESRPFRNAAGDLTRHITDSLLALNSGAKIIVMGDLNDDPINESVVQHLRTKSDVENLEQGDLYNPYFNMFRDGRGSLCYRDKWNLFDMIIVSQGLVNGNKSGYKFSNAEVFDKEIVREQEGKYKGYPLRTFAGGKYLNGYSDHFPSYIILDREDR